MHNLKTKVVVYNDTDVISIMVRDRIENEDGFRFLKYKRRFLKGLPNNLTIGSVVNYADVDMIVVKINSNRLKLKVL